MENRGRRIGEKERERGGEHNNEVDKLICGRVRLSSSLSFVARQQIRCDKRFPYLQWVNKQIENWFDFSTMTRTAHYILVYMERWWIKLVHKTSDNLFVHTRYTQTHLKIVSAVTATGAQATKHLVLLNATWWMPLVGNWWRALWHTSMF